MKLSKQHREVFVRAVMADVPKVDYAALIRKELTNTVLSVLPSEIRDFFKSEKNRQDWLNHSSTYINDLVEPNRGAYINYAGPTTGDLAKLDPEFKSRIEALTRQAAEQWERIKQMQNDVSNLICAFGTLKAAKEGLPEQLVKYLPSDTAVPKTANLPANITDITNRLTKMGWPIGKAKQIVESAIEVTA